MHRRTLLAAPAALALAAAAPPPDWRRDVSELRFGGTGPATAARARALARHLGVAVHPIDLPPPELARAMAAGQLECAALGPAAAPARAIMGPRLLAARHGAVLRGLPPALRDDLQAALRRTGATA